MPGFDMEYDGWYRLLRVVWTSDRDEEEGGAMFSDHGEKRQYVAMPTQRTQLAHASHNQPLRMGQLRRAPTVLLFRSSERVVVRLR
jgi:hypothetical protein